MDILALATPGIEYINEGVQTDSYTPASSISSSGSNTPLSATNTQSGTNTPIGTNTPSGTIGSSSQLTTNTVEELEK